MGKKIAILSMQQVLNFGSVLQAYSLRQIIEEVTGVKASFLDIQEDQILPSKKTVKESMDYETAAVYPPGVFQRGKRWLNARLSKIRQKKIRRFMRQEHLIQPEENHKYFDCVVVGSDEVFNHVRGVNLQLHGKVKNADKRISYAASCGSARIEDVAEEYMAAIQEAMAGFGAISVRDQATENYVSAIYHGTISHHLDPVLVGNLCNRRPRRVPIKKYLLVYAYGQRIRTEQEIRAIQNFARSRGLKTVAIGGTQFWCDLYIPTSPMRALDYFYYADFVVTDTFHGAIFSVIHQKQFAVILRKTNVNKLSGLLEDLKLEERRLQDISQLETVLQKPINYVSVQEILEYEKKRARQYLKDQLGE